MPIIPGYDSKRNITSERPVPIMNEAAQVYDAPLKAIEVATDINQKWLEAQDTMDYTKYKADYATAQARIEAEAENDEDLEGSAVKIKDLTKAKDDALKGIRNKALAQKVAFEADSDVAVASFKIQNTYNKKKLLVNDVNLDNNINIAAQQRGGLLNNPTLLVQADKSTFALIQANVSKGTITPVRGKDLWEKYQEGAVDFNIQADTSTSQEQSPVLRELLKGEKGVYGNMPPDKLANKIKDAKINIWRNKNAAKKAEAETYTQSSLDMGNMLVNQSLSLSSIENMRKSGQIDSVTASIFSNAIDKRTLTEPTENINVMAFIGMLDKGDKLKAADVVKEATKLRGSKGFDDKAYGFVLQEAAKIFDREKKKQNPLDSALSSLLLGAKSIEVYGKAVSSTLILPKNAGEAINKMLSLFIDKVNSGIAPKDAEEEIIKTQVEDDLSNYNNSPKIRVNRISDGKAGSILEKDFNQSIYEKL